MPRIAIAFALLVLACGLGLRAADAASVADYPWIRDAKCAPRMPPVDDMLAACTTIIDARGETRGARSLALAVRGFAHFVREEDALALADYTAALRLVPDSIEALYGRAFLYRAKPDGVHAQADADAALALNPELLRTFHATDGRNCDRSCASYFMINYAFEARELTPTVKGYWGRGGFYENHQPPRYDLALADYTAMLHLNPTSIDGLRDRAKLYAHFGKTDQAIADYSAAIAIAPDHDLLAARGALYERKGDADAALADYAEAIRIAPLGQYVQTFILAHTYAARGNLLLNKGQGAAALADCDTAIKLSHRDAWSFLARSLAHDRLGNYAEAIADFEQGRVLSHTPPSDPQFADAYYRRGAANLEQLRYDPAIADFTAAVALDPSHAQAFNDRGYARQMLDDWPAALADFEKAAALKPGYAAAVFNRDRLRVWMAPRPTGWLPDDNIVSGPPASNGH